MRIVSRVISRVLLCCSLSLLFACDSAETTTPNADSKATAPTNETVESEAKTTHVVTIVAQVPADSPDIFVSGNLPALGSWHPRGLKMAGSGSTRRAEVQVPKGHGLQFKITAGSWEQEGLGPEGALLPNFGALVVEDMEITADIALFRTDPRELIATWQGSGVHGKLVYWLDMPSKHLKETRHVVIWLPPGYDINETYKVIYMQDGQNLFDPRMSYSNVDWGVDEAMVKGVQAGLYEPAIIVGIWNTPDRLLEYSPAHQAANYARFILEELKPRVDKEFAVKTGPENTFAMGSSMGGLMSLYLVQNFPETFGACGCVSSHVSWSEQQLAWYRGKDFSASEPTPYIIASITNGAVMPAGKRLYFDYGTKGLDADYEKPTLAVRDWLVGQGYTEGENLKIKKFDGADHNEASWRERVGEQLEWMLAD